MRLSIEIPLICSISYRTCKQNGGFRHADSLDSRLSVDLLDSLGNRLFSKTKQQAVCAHKHYTSLHIIVGGLHNESFCGYPNISDTRCSNNRGSTVQQERIVIAYKEKRACNSQCILCMHQIVDESAGYTPTAH